MPREQGSTDVKDSHVVLRINPPGEEEIKQTLPRTPVRPFAGLPTFEYKPTKREQKHPDALTIDVPTIINSAPSWWSWIRIRLYVGFLSAAYLGSMFSMVWFLFQENEGKDAIDKESEEKKKNFRITISSFAGGVCFGLLSVTSKTLQKFIGFLYRHIGELITLQGFAVSVTGAEDEQAWRTPTSDLILFTTSPFFFGMSIARSAAKKFVPKSKKRNASLANLANRAQQPALREPCSQMLKKSGPALAFSAFSFSLGVVGLVKEPQNIWLKITSEVGVYLGIFIPTRIFSSIGLRNIFLRYAKIFQGVSPVLVSFLLSNFGVYFSTPAMVVLAVILASDKAIQSERIILQAQELQTLRNNLSANPAFVENLKQILASLPEETKQEPLWGEASFGVTKWNRRIFAGLLAVTGYGFTRSPATVIQFATAHLFLLLGFYISNFYRLSKKANESLIGKLERDELVNPLSYMANVSFFDLLSAHIFWVNHAWNPNVKGGKVSDDVNFGIIPVNHSMFFWYFGKYKAQIYTRAYGERVPKGCVRELNGLFDLLQKSKAISANNSSTTSLSMSRQVLKNVIQLAPETKAITSSSASESKSPASVPASTPKPTTVKKKQFNPQFTLNFGSAFIAPNAKVLVEITPEKDNFGSETEKTGRGIATVTMGGDLWRGFGLR